MFCSDSSLANQLFQPQPLRSTSSGLIDSPPWPRWQDNLMECYIAFDANQGARVGRAVITLRDLGFYGVSESTSWVARLIVRRRARKPSIVSSGGTLSQLISDGSCRAQK